MLLLPALLRGLLSTCLCRCICLLLPWERPVSLSADPTPLSLPQPAAQGGEQHMDGDKWAGLLSSAPLLSLVPPLLRTQHRGCAVPSLCSGRSPAVPKTKVTGGWDFPLHFPGQSSWTTTKQIPRGKSSVSELSTRCIYRQLSKLPPRRTRQSNGSALDFSYKPLTASNPLQGDFYLAKHPFFTLSTVSPLTNISVYSLELCHIEP